VLVIVLEGCGGSLVVRGGRTYGVEGVRYRFGNFR
jgi:hypothetical protein